MKAIILCAGKGTRLQPLTLNKPKPLLEIKGKTLLENAILHLRKCGVEEIIVVTGYKHHLFDPLEKKLNFKKIVNPHFETTNSNTSFFLGLQAINLNTLQNGILVINGDSYIKESFLSTLDKTKSTLFAQRLEHTRYLTWAFICDKNSKITHIDTNAKNGLCEVGISYITKTDLETLRHYNLHPNAYFENLFLDNLDKINLYAQELEDKVYEVDSYLDAQEIGLSAQEFAEQCSQKECNKLGGFTNDNFKITLDCKNYVLRIPGIGSEAFVDRKAEQAITSILPQDVSVETHFFNDSIKLTTFLEGYTDMINAEFDTAFFHAFCKTLKKMHTLNLKDFPSFKSVSLKDEITKYESLAKKSLISKEQRNSIIAYIEIFEKDTQVLCHRDLLQGNIMYNGVEVRLVDFEYSGFSSKYWDIANFICESNISEPKRYEFIEIYGNLEDTKVRQMQLLVHYIWGLWFFVNRVESETKKHFDNLQRNFLLLQKGLP